VILELKARQVRQAPLGQLVPPAQLVRLAHKVRKAHQEMAVLPEALDHRVPLVLQEPLVPRVQKDPPVLKVRLDLLVLKVRLDLLAPQEYYSHMSQLLKDGD
jgi:hypothetical protein